MATGSLFALIEEPLPELGVFVTGGPAIVSGVRVDRELDVAAGRFEGVHHVLVTHRDAGIGLPKIAIVVEYSEPNPRRSV